MRGGGGLFGGLFGNKGFGQQFGGGMQGGGMFGGQRGGQFGQQGGGYMGYQRNAMDIFRTEAPRSLQDAMVFLQPAAVMTCAAILGMAFFSDVRRLGEIRGDQGRSGEIRGHPRHGLLRRGHSPQPESQPYP